MASKQIAKDLNGINTEVVIQTFADRILVLVTQLGKVGNLIQASLPATTPLLPVPAPDPENPNALLLPPPPPAIQLVPLLGNAPSEHIQTLHNLFVSQIATLVWESESESMMQPTRKSVVVGIALRKHNSSGIGGLDDSERATFSAVMGMVQDLLKQ
ncbi:hypothetical protein CPB85DRAFT_1381706 [Mucidula mucida]|nr:hypothetical protein CPB85DRAFT_1381706 [Mucidula mucida]